MSHEYTFRCPLPNGLHVRPAGQLAEVASRFSSEVRLINERTGAEANAKSLLAVVAIDIRLNDPCRVCIAGGDADAALAAISDFAASSLPARDEPLAVPATGGEVALPRSLRREALRWFQATPVCRGIGKGVVVPIGGLAMPTGLETKQSGSVDDERGRVNRAIMAVCGELKAKLATRPTATEATVLRAHLSIAGDVALKERITESVAAGSTASQAIVEGGTFFAARLKDAESVYVRERAIDVEDVCRRLLEQICGSSVPAAEVELTEASVVVADNLTPRQVLSLDKRLLRALVLEHAGTTSHAVILARSFGIPTLTGVADARANLPAGREVIVDANLGIVITEINGRVRRYFDRQRKTLCRRKAYLAKYAGKPAATLDGQRLEVAANVATADEVAVAIEQGAEGIGVFRTEMLFMDRGEAPSEEEQLAAYIQAARGADGRPVIIRTIDIGGDKPLPYLNLAREANPFLGYRGVRIYHEHLDVITAQLRAIIRASAFGSVRLMVPMICSIDEVRWVKERIAEIRTDLQAAGVAFDPAMQVGVMVEVPSAVFLLDQLCDEVDFFSIGTNDLLQYFFAADRSNDKVADLCKARNPAFLRLLVEAIDDVHLHNRWVGMCGEMAGDLQSLPLLVGLGLNEISVAGPDVPTLKAAVAQLSAAECREVLSATLACRSNEEVDALLAGVHWTSPASLIDPDLIKVGSDSSGKEEVIEEIAGSLYATGRAIDPVAVEEAFWAREETSSTGVGHGFAIPHCRTDAVVANSVGVVRLQHAIEWDSAEGQPVECVILLAIRESGKGDAHMKILATLARKLVHEEFRNRLLAAPDGEAVQRCLLEELGLGT